MLKIATSEEMQRIDRTAIETYGIAGTVLMERAGLRVVARINELFFQGTEQRVPGTDKNRGRKIIVFCGGGNNGGDGLVIARVLHNQGREVEAYVTVNPASLKGDAKINYRAAGKYGVVIRPVSYFLKHYRSCVTCNCLIVDALLGTGLRKEVRALLADVIGKINRMSAPVVSVDIPSGICSDTGQIMGCAIKAQFTVTFGLPKRGHFLYPGAEFAGQLFIEEIGFPRKLIESEKIRINLVQKEDVSSLLPVRPKYSHKGTYGHVLIVAGSKGKTGAALMAAKACFRTGAGLVTIGIPETLLSTFQSRVTEEMILPLPDTGNGTLSYRAADSILDFLKKTGNVLAIGPGLSPDNELSKLLNVLIRESGVPIVIDADGLNAIADNVYVLKKSSVPVILTPHPGEMTRLLKKESGGRNQSSGATGLREKIEKDRINIALTFARKTKTYLVLKGVPTVTSTPQGEAFINSTGNPGMATAGSGDVLTGMISAFLAQGMSPADASVMGVFLHGVAGDIIAEKKSQQSLTASDIIKAIPSVLKSIQKP
ncbi:MAG TPA: bifunctional ADP-dependent NAD(P)H-hydrate dehydratase/NAD(P)H-hydrate epimerase [Nitrospiraceae bacterium]|nr:bifunctional ADP-dependent NAD(P)H-hydrate dehydratase/NAD(P)H-hydrate epimerase [Nitrospiraceae bacterium]